MDQNLKKTTHLRVERVISNLEKNNMKGYFVDSLPALKECLSTLIPTGSTIAVGGSQTLFETGTLDWIRANNYRFYDRYAPGLTPIEIKEVHRKAFSVDVYLCSTNAITESGTLYNVDGSGNRVAAMIFGPDRVIVLAGVNKIVKDEADAIRRNREMSGPTNSMRLNLQTPCVHTGTCTDCISPDRICSAYTFIKYQREKNRIHVILIDDAFGY